MEKISECKLIEIIFVVVENVGAQVWWSPCPSRECPDSEELDIVVDQCLDHCLLLEQNPKIEIIAPPTKAPMVRPKEDNGEIDDLNFHLSKRKHKDPSKTHHHGVNSTTTTTTTTTSESI